jgi:hypothetical protein
MHYVLTVHPKMVLNKLAPQNALMVHRLSKLGEIENPRSWPTLEANQALKIAQEECAED